MRTLSALLMVLLLCSLQQTCSGSEGTENGADCCTKLTKVKIPIRRIVSYKKTPNNCPVQAVVFQTVKGENVCVDFSLDWAKSHVKVVDLRKNTTTTAQTLSKP